MHGLDRDLLGPEAEGHKAPIFVVCLILDGEPDVCDFSFFHWVFGWFLYVKPVWLERGWVWPVARVQLYPGLGTTIVPGQSGDVKGR